jgi:hypothetical protein
VTGEPGIGKTALLDQWSADALGRGAVVLRGRAEEGELALQPVLDALAARLAVPVLDAAAPGGLPGPDASADTLNLRVFARIDETLGASEVHDVEGRPPPMLTAATTILATSPA